MPRWMTLNRAASSGARRSLGRVSDGPRLPSPFAPWQRAQWTVNSFSPRARSTLPVGSLTLGSDSAATARIGHSNANNAFCMVGVYRITGSEQPEIDLNVGGDRYRL